MFSSLRMLGVPMTSLRMAAACAAFLTLCQTAEATIVGFWEFNAGTGTSAVDSSGNGNTGTLVSGATWFNDPERGWVLSTDISSQRVEVPFGSSSSLATMGSAFSMSMWVKENANSNYGHLLVLSNNGSARNWLWQSESSSGGDQSYVWSTTATQWQRGLGWTIPNSTWYQYTFTYAGGNLRSYRNGVQNGNYTISGSVPLPQVTGTWNIGGWNAFNSSFRGYMSDVSFWSVGLSAGKASSMYNITTVNSGALADYDALRMEDLFASYDMFSPATITSTAGTLNWSRFDGVSGTAGAAAFDAGSSTYRVWFDGTSGVIAVPEPTNLVLVGSAVAATAVRLATGRRRRRAPAAPRSVRLAGR
jgi:hypothetical protein